MGDDDPDDFMETSLTFDYDKQWINNGCVSAIGPLFPSYLSIRERAIVYSREYELNLNTNSFLNTNSTQIPSIFENDNKRTCTYYTLLSTFIPYNTEK